MNPETRRSPHREIRIGLTLLLVLAILAGSESLVPAVYRILPVIHNADISSCNLSTEICTSNFTPTPTRETAHRQPNNSTPLPPQPEISDWDWYCQQPGNICLYAEPLY
jgi:hypothetical protein